MKQKLEKRLHKPFINWRHHEEMLKKTQVGYQGKQKLNCYVGKSYKANK